MGKGEGVLGKGGGVLGKGGEELGKGEEKQVKGKVFWIKGQENEVRREIQQIDDYQKSMTLFRRKLMTDIDHVYCVVIVTGCPLKTRCSLNNQNNEKAIILLFVNDGDYHM